MRQDITVEAFYDAAWNTVPVFEEGGVQVVHGRASAEDLTQPSNVQLTIDNRTAAYHPRNAESSLFGKFTRNTQLRVRLGASTIRGVGELGAMRPGRNLKGNKVWMEAQADGVTRRLGQGAASLQTAFFRRMLEGGGSPSLDPFVRAYWPLNEGAIADFGAPAVGPYECRLSSKALIKPNEGELAPWIGTGVRILGGTVGAPYIQGEVPGPHSSASDFSVECVFADAVGVWSLLAYCPSDNGRIWRVRFDSVAGQVSVRTRDGGESSSETTQATASTSAADDRGFHHVMLLVEDNGTGVDYTVYIDGIAVIGPTTKAADETFGIARIRVSGDASASSFVNVGHVAGRVTSSIQSEDDPAFGWQGEAAGRRIERLCSENGITFTSTGDLDDTSPCGPQHSDTLLNLLQEAAFADLGILYDTLDAVGLHYRTRRSMDNQNAALTLDFSAGNVNPPLDPEVDDLAIRNDVTVTRQDGSSARRILTSGTLSTAAPPSGVGIYDTDVTITCAGDGKMLEDQAGWRLHLGTVDEDRFSRLTVDLDRNPSLATTVNALRVGDRIVVNNLPDHLSNNPLSLIVEGWTESLQQYRRVITFNCSPESSHRVAVYQSGTGSTVHKYDTGGSTLSSGINSSATSLSVATATGHPLWTAVDAEDGFDIHIGGERMTVTDISGAASPQTFTVTRSVNGVVKSHSSGAAVRLWQTPVYSL